MTAARPEGRHRSPPGSGREPRSPPLSSSITRDPEDTAARRRAPLCSDVLALLSWWLEGDPWAVARMPVSGFPGSQQGGVGSSQARQVPCPSSGPACATRRCCPASHALPPSCPLDLLVQSPLVTVRLGRGPPVPTGSSFLTPFPHTATHQVSPRCHPPLCSARLGEGHLEPSPAPSPAPTRSFCTVLIQQPAHTGPASAAPSPPPGYRRAGVLLRGVVRPTPHIRPGQHGLVPGGGALVGHEVLGLSPL